jgi:glycosyltransferase involved in cell wall biosynthesis
LRRGERLRILYITLEDLSLHKGSVVHVREIVGGLRRIGQEVSLVARSSKGPVADRGFYCLTPVGKLLPKWVKRGWGGYLVSSVLLFVWLLRSLQQHDVVYARDFHTVIIAFLPRLIFRKKLVFEINGLASEEHRTRARSVLNRVVTFLIQHSERAATQWSDRIVGVTPQIASYLITRFGCPGDKLRVVGNGVDTQRFFPIENRDCLQERRNEIGIGQEELVVSFVGNLAPWQGIDTVIAAAPIVLKEFEKVRFLIIGDGILKDQLRSEVNKLGLAHHFIFTGMVDYEQIPVFLNISDICLLPKRRLASGYSPIKVYEYLACAKPVVASRVAGLEFIEREGAGLLTEPEDAMSLANGLVDLLRDSEKRQAMGDKGLRIVQERFHWNQKAAEIYEIIRELA